MRLMVRVDNLSGNIATVQYIFNAFESRKDLSPEQIVTIKLRIESPRGWINQEPLI